MRVHTLHIVVFVGDVEADLAGAPGAWAEAALVGLAGGPGVVAGSSSTSYKDAGGRGSSEKVTTSREKEVHGGGAGARVRPCWTSCRPNRPPKGNQQLTPDGKERNWPRPSGRAGSSFFFACEFFCV
jgi:hypothetical protein